MAQAKVLAPDEVDYIAQWIVTTRQDTDRDLCIFYLSVYAGFRAKEIANVTWDMVTDASGRLIEAIHLTNTASKGSTGGRVVPIHPKLMVVLRTLYEVSGCCPKGNIIRSHNGGIVSPHYIVKKFGYWYHKLDMKGCSSHSGRRTMITKLARNIAAHGGSMRDVQALAGHTTLAMTQRYVVVNEAAQKAAVTAM